MKLGTVVLKGGVRPFWDQIFLSFFWGFNFENCRISEMFGAAAVRKKKQKALDQANKGDEPLHPYIKPFGTRFDPSELPYFKYKKTLEDAKELSKNVSGAPVAPTQTAKKVPRM